MLEVHDLHASINGIGILNGVTLTVNAGEVHAIMGPNGSGKSTLANVLAGNPMYKVTGGTVSFAGADLLKMPPEERARSGIFLSFQHPSEIPGVRLDHFIRGGVNAVRKSHAEEEIGVLQFDKLLKEKAKVVEMDSSLTKRPVNDGFSGGEKERSEILQMALLEPKLAILDEVDSGLDVDALRIVASGINALRTPENAMVLVTHYQRILNYVAPDFVHVLINGRIMMSGGKELALEIESKGYDWVAEATDALPSSG